LVGGVNAPLPLEAKKILSHQSYHFTAPHPHPHSENCSFYIIIIIYLLKSTEQEDAHMINTRTRAGARFSKLLKKILGKSYEKLKKILRNAKKSFEN